MAGEFAGQAAGSLFIKVFTKGDEMETGKITVRKYSQEYKFEDNSLLLRRGSPEENAAFELRAAEDIYAADELIYRKDEPVCEWLLTDRFGLAETEQLPYGRYSLYDLAHQSAEPVSVTLAGEKEFVSVNDQLDLGTIKIKNKSRYDAAPRIYSAEGELILISAIESNAALSYDEMLPAGLYSVKIDDIPAIDFRIDNNCAEIEFSEKGILLKMTEKRVSEREFILYKKDENGRPQMGAVFGLIDIDGTKICFSCSDRDGRVQFQHLQKGMYMVREVEAPEGYCESEMNIIFTVDDDWTNQSDRIAAGAKPEDVYVTLTAMRSEAEYDYEEEEEIEL